MTAKRTILSLKNIFVCLSAGLLVCSLLFLCPRLTQETEVADAAEEAFGTQGRRRGSPRRDRADPDGNPRRGREDPEDRGERP